MFGGMQAVAQPNPNGDILVANGPTDGISCVKFSPVANNLVAGSWDNQIRFWEVQATGATVPKAAQTYDAPILSCAWSHDGMRVFTGGCDKQAKCWDLASNQVIQVGAHDAPVRYVFWLHEMTPNCVVTGSWDKTLKYWDCRAPAPVLTVPLTERVYCMDATVRARGSARARAQLDAPQRVRPSSLHAPSALRGATAAAQYPLLTVSTADRKVIVFDLNNPQRPFREIESPLKFQSRCVANFTDKTGFCLASVEGRVAVQHVDPANQAKNFAFKCHRESTTNDIWAVNWIAFHPKFGTFATLGADGSYNFWDKDKCGPRASARIALRSTIRRAHLRATRRLPCGCSLRALPAAGSASKNLNASTRRSRAARSTTMATSLRTPRRTTGAKAPSTTPSKRITSTSTPCRRRR